MVIEGPVELATLQDRLGVVQEYIHVHLACKMNPNSLRTNTD